MLFLASACSDSPQAPSTNGSGSGGSAGTSVMGTGGQGGSLGGAGGAGGSSIVDASGGMDSSDSGGSSSVDAGQSDAVVATDTSASDTGATDAEAGARDTGATAETGPTWDGGSKCATPCSASAPVCDESTGTCTPIELVAFYTVYEKMADLAHRSFSHEANAWFPTVAQANGFTFESTTDWTRLNTVAPAKGRIVLFFDNAPRLDVTQQASFKSYVEKGGAWMGFHVSAYNDPSAEFNYPWFFREFLGCGKFFNNTWKPTPANLKVEDMTHPATAGLGTMFMSAPSEWYSWEIDLRTKPNIKVLCSVDPSSFPLGTDPAQSWRSGYYPIVWTNTNFKMLYMNFGHNDMDYGPKPDGKTLSFTFSSQKQNQMIFQAIRWLAGVSK